MPTTEVKPPVGEQGTGEQTDLICAACPHAWHVHDPIGIRYCSATVSGQLHRGCVCVGNTGALAISSPNCLA
ncbi:MAG: RGCVC family protein [Pseudonocardiaceae bacterium]